MCSALDLEVTFRPRVVYVPSIYIHPRIAVHIFHHELTYNVCIYVKAVFFTFFLIQPCELKGLTRTYKIRIRFIFLMSH